MRHMTMAATAVLLVAVGMATAQTLTRGGATSSLDAIGEAAGQGSESSSGGVTVTITESALTNSAEFDYTIRVPVDLENMQRQTTRFRVDCELFTPEDNRVLPAGRGSRVVALDPTTGTYSGMVSIGVNHEPIRVDQNPPAGVTCRLRLCNETECALPTGNGILFNSYDSTRPSRLSETEGL